MTSRSSHAYVKVNATIKSREAVFVHNNFSKQAEKTYKGRGAKFFMLLQDKRRLGCVFDERFIISEFPLY